ncbi:MAG: LamG-like jellyroll fold domain-containing protein [Planctomycetota bacterium]
MTEHRSRLLRALGLALFVFAASNSARAELVSHWPLDGDFDDIVGGNDGFFVGEEFPVFSDGYDGTGEAAISLDGVDDYIELAVGAGLPVYNEPAYSVAMWVKGLPQNDRRLYSEASSTENTTLFNIGTQNTGAAGTVDLFIRTATGALPQNHRNSTGIAFDGTWHHVAWVDEGGNAVLYIDGQRDATDFSYAKPALDIDYSSVGAVVRPSRAPPECCLFLGEIDDVRVYDHALTEEEVRELLPLDDCPAEGDTHCDGLDVTPPVAGLGTPGIYEVIATAVDDSGDEILYTFRATETGGEVRTVGPQSLETAQFDLQEGSWTISVSVDDSGLCPDVAGDATCSAEPIDIACPTEGDTHCDDLVVDGPIGGGPGIYTASVLGASDDSDDAITYSYRATSDSGAVLLAPANDLGFADFNIQASGEWTFEVTVDDDAFCDDVADDATCVEIVDVECPTEGDSHCDDLLIDGPFPDPGTYTISAEGSDDSGDFVQYVFRLSNGEQEYSIGPQDLNSVTLTLGVGTWDISVSIDDDPLCDDVADDAMCTEELVIEGLPPQLVSHWTFDETLEDSAGENDAVFHAGVDPVAETYVDGFDGSPFGAISLDGLDDYLEIPQGEGLPLYANADFTIAMWVKGPPQPDRRIWSEGSTLDNAPLFNLGTEVAGNAGTVDFFLRGGPGVGTVVGHRQSARVAFDDAWHHVAWVDRNGNATLYIDGVRDATDFSYERPPLGLDTASIGGILRAGPCCWFGGTLDEVRIYNYALSEEEVLGIVPEPDDCSSSGDTHCDDLSFEGPEGNVEGVYTFTVTGASDDSGDPISYLFIATTAEGGYVQQGPGLDNFANLTLTEGEWTVTVTVDDNILCRNTAADASCSETVSVVAEPELLVAHFLFDGDFDDATGGNDGIPSGAAAFADDRDGNPDSALTLDGQSYVALGVESNSGLPITNRARYSVAMWVNGMPQNDRRVYSEESSTNNSPLFNIGTEFSGNTGQVDLYIRDGGVAYPGNGHRLSNGIAFDGTWHHIAWVDDNGTAVLYIDGERDAQDFTYNKDAFATILDTSHVGAVVRAARTPPPCCQYTGAIDDVRIYNYVLSEDEVRAIVDGDEPPPPPVGTPFKRGDADASGSVNITDGIFVLNFLFLGGPGPSCAEAGDADDSGAINITDGIFILNFLFLGGPDPAAPGANDCGVDPEGSPEAGCESFPACADV